jgi:single-stranded DNA-binding protein
MNSVCVIGRLTRNPVVRFAGEGVQTASATLLIEEPRTREKPLTLYVPLTFWGQAAEVASTLGAQDMVAVTGKLCWRTVHTKVGDRSSLAVEVHRVQRLQAEEVAR